MRRVQYKSLGGPEVLKIVEVEAPHAAAGEVRVRVKVAGLNPHDAKLFLGAPTASGNKPNLPSGNGADFAGEIDEVGEGVTDWEPGDAVYGQVQSGAQADYLIIAAELLTRKPENLPYQIAGSLSIAGRTAWNSTMSLNLSPDDTVFVSAAAGAVGALTAQLAIRAGATVIGSASPSHHEYLRLFGVVPIEYGDGLLAALQAAAPIGISAALDNHGRASVEAALAAGAPPGRINSIADYAAAEKYGTTAVGGHEFNRESLEIIASLIVSGELDFPIESVFALNDVVEAYERLLGSHGPGKIILLVEDE
jgi:NADPH:quinone reductase-like Zn-dependent oxidoreductase